MGAYASIGSRASSRSRVSGVANNRVREIALSLGDAFWFLILIKVKKTCVISKNFHEPVTYIAFKSFRLRKCRCRLTHLYNCWLN